MSLCDFTCLVAAAFLIAAAPPALAQQRADADRQPGELIPRAHANETYLFRSILKFVGVEPVESLPDRRAELRNLVYIAFGEIPRNRIDEARRVLDAGGAVLIATDRRMNLERLFDKPGLLAIGLHQVESFDPTPETCFNGDRSMPFLVPPDEQHANPDLARMTALPRVAMNGPSAFSRTLANNLNDLGRPLALFPGACRTTTGGRLVIPVAGLMNDPVNRQGSVLVVYADGGIFTNQMLMARGTENFAYSYYLARYLTTGPIGDRKRNRCLFIEDGVARTDFDLVPLLSQAELPPLPPPPIPSLDDIQQKVTDTVNATLDDIQTRDSLGRAAARNYHRVAPALALAAAVFAAVVAARLLWRSRHEPEFTIPSATTDQPGSTLDRQRQDVLRSNDVYEPLREHLRELFARWGGPDGGLELPPIETAGPAAERRMLLAQLRKLWEIAHGNTPTAIPFIRWKEIEPMIESVTQAAEAGRWRFARPGGGA